MHCNLRPVDITPVVMGFNYKAHNNAPAYRFNTSATSFGFIYAEFLACTDILAIGGHLSVFRPQFHCACAEITSISEPVKILISPLYSATPIS